MRQALVVVSVAVLSACNNTPDQNVDLAALEAEVAQLRTDLTAAQATIATLQAEASANASTVEAAAAIQTYLSVNEDGDLVIEGANLHIRNGAGSTTAMNGKGNLILGYNAVPGTCSGGTYDGRSCIDDLDCAGASCVPNPDPARDGSHNLVIGDGHSYRCSTSAIFGVLNSVDSAMGAAVLGGLRNSVTGSLGLVVAGENNRAGGGVVLGGSNNYAARSDSVVVGGSNNTTTTDGSILP